MYDAKTVFKLNAHQTVTLKGMDNHIRATLVESEFGGGPNDREALRDLAKHLRIRAAQIDALAAEVGP